MSYTLKLLIVVAGFGVLSGCDATEPYDRPYVWRPTGANEANLAAMAVNPRDLVRGRGVRQADGQSAASAIERLYQNRVKPLAGADQAAAPAAATSLTPN